MGTAARLLPASLSAMPFIPDIVAATPWFALTALLGLLCSVAGRRRILALVMVACLILQAYWQLPFFSHIAGAPSRSSAAQTGGAISVMTCNVYKGHADAARIVQLVHDNNVKVLALQETTPDFEQRLEESGIREYLPYTQWASADGMYGNDIWSATPLDDPVRDEVFASSSQMPAGTVTLASGTRLRFVSVHTTAPVSGYWNLWKRSLDEIGAMNHRADTTYVFMGDFNATYDHAPFREMIGDRFTDAARAAGMGFTFSWPADRGGIPPLFAIDHIILDQGLSSDKVRVEQVDGTDHAALLSTLYA